MGYDMHINADMTEAEQLAKDAAQQQFDAAVAVRNKRDRQLKDEGAEWPHIVADPEHVAAQEEVEKAYEALSAAEVNYYRLNIWGMGRCREYMADRGMLALDYDDSSKPDWPAYDGSATDRRNGESEEEWRERYREYDRQHDEACLPVQSWSPEGVGNLIPIHKLSDNSGWLVTEIECKTAAAIGREAPFPTYTDDDGTEKPVLWWESWLAFLERASTRGGFQVH